MFGTKILEEKKSKYNGNLRVVRSFGLGTYIQANGLTQSGGIVESMWKSTIKRIAYRDQRIVKNCLILGLGGGTLVKLVNRYWPDAKITGVDIDPIIVELGEKYLKSDFSKINVQIADAYELVSTYSLSPIRYDLIVVDLYNGDQFPKKFESDKFLKLIPKLLSGDGVVVFNRLYYKDKIIEAEKFGVILAKVYHSVEKYRPVSNLMFICR